MRLKAAGMPRQLGMRVHLRPSWSAAMEAGITTIRLTTAMAEEVIPAHPSCSPSIDMHAIACGEV